ncbi:MAG: serine--tRNA ligase [Candidatus Magasanikbacteria bacterium RIFOXYC2_FULL_40_16]|uniref:Serine--tRNA ligase n=2 Tax=Candidatus Magasanikiibacteriota TaxID=1752731 RepID=A0A1F6P1A9_9BACT|nr:MAG: serine--tRNA ligase [Candidatus Magasanikbacteria bacterium RIFOXYA1_FULL_40_8]OGH89763.1 MAG: serine--tRNA ligase [Candidatus Magasanikbacteria bacterium RIFOXYC2_FULL_40_16]
MLDVKFIKENFKLVADNCVNRGVKVDLKKFLDLDEARRKMITKIEEMRAQRNTKSKTKPTEEEIKLMKEVGEEIKNLEVELKSINEEHKNLLYKIPNLSHPESPVGGEDKFTVVYEYGKPPKFDFTPKTHEQIMLDLDLVDFDRGTKVAGSKFYFVKNDAVRLNQALLNYGLDILEKHNFVLMETPDLAKEAILDGAGFNPRSEEESQIYSIENTDLKLIATAEIPLLGFHSDEVIDLSAGPKKYAAISHCFRTEAGAYGKAGKGLYRVHQFTKLEMFVYCKPEDSEKLHKELLEIEKEICKGLDLHYRVIDIPTGDLGGPAYRKYDIEAWMTMQGKNGGYGEITSASNCTDFQARRLNIKYKIDAGKPEYAHTLNGTAVVLSRFPIAVLENHQNKDGSVSVPKALRKHMGKKKIKK